MIMYIVYMMRTVQLKSMLDKSRHKRLPTLETRDLSIGKLHSDDTTVVVSPLHKRSGEIRQCGHVPKQTQNVRGKKANTAEGGEEEAGSSLNAREDRYRAHEMCTNHDRMNTKTLECI